MSSRTPIGYVVQVDSGSITLNLLERHRGQVASHRLGVSPVTDIGGMLAIDGGHRLLVMKVSTVSFAEPMEVHRQGYRPRQDVPEPLRQLSGTTVGWLEKTDGSAEFYADNLVTPALGAEAFPLTAKEIQAILEPLQAKQYVNLGKEYRTGSSVHTGINQLLAQHVAVLGSSGQGKTSFTAAVLQQLAELPKSRIVIFDINGEYNRAFRKSEHAIDAGDHGDRLEPRAYKYTVIGESIDDAPALKIPYYALGRQGLHRLLVPSEKTQRPALSFAVDKLKNIEWDPNAQGASLVGQAPVLFDDCRQDGARTAKQAIDRLRDGNTQEAAVWPHMSSLAALVAESHSLTQGRNGIERNAFNYGNVAPLITRIHRLVEDEMLQAVVDVTGGQPAPGVGSLNWQAESEHLVEQIFGDQDSEWRVHVVNLRQVPQDLMPLVLGSLLELYAHVLFRRGQGNSPATLLVLEEAHHYLRSTGESDDNGNSALAYERLAKEGRKFGLSLWLSTQRPAEVSPTVLSQCSSWASFRLTSEQDLRAIASASEWADPREVRSIAGLPKRQAIIFGSGTAIATRVNAPIADPAPESSDGPFDSWGAS